ncbi:MAG: PD40 domain-containing protein [Opitutales bacterium]|nr:PD40 domain-containing protein [Opitutales bacterium]
MKLSTATRLLAVSACVPATGTLYAQSPSTNLFDYFGQVPPGNTAQIFAPSIISNNTTKEGALAISPKGDEVFFVRGQWPNTTIMQMKKSNGEWSTAVTAAFSEDCGATEPAFSPDGRYLYFSSNRGKSEIRDYSIWRVENLGDGMWSRPESLFDIDGGSVWEFHPTLTAQGELFFCYWDAAHQRGDVYVSHEEDGSWSEPLKVEAPVSTDFSEVDPFVDADGRFMLFSSNRPGGLGGEDQYVSVRDADGVWTQPYNLGLTFNTDGDDFDMDLTPDGKYILLYREGDVYWMGCTPLEAIFKSAQAKKGE